MEKTTSARVSPSRRASDNSGSLVDRVAEDLRQLVFQTPDGEFLGGQDELRLQLGVSRPTLRQAAKILEQEKLLVIRRGMGGGFFAGRPDSGTVGRTTAVYLRADECSLSQLIAAVRPLYVESARLAAERASEPNQKLLGEFAERERSELNTGSVQTRQVFQEAERDFVQLLANAADNPLIRVFMEVATDLSTQAREILRPEGPEEIRAYRKGRLFLIDAILDRDPDVAELAARRLNQRTAEWAAKDTDFGGRLSFAPF